MSISIRDNTVYNIIYIDEIMVLSGCLYTMRKKERFGDVTLFKIKFRSNFNNKLCG